MTLSISYLSFRNGLDLSCFPGFDKPPILNLKPSFPHFRVNLLSETGPITDNIVDSSGRGNLHSFVIFNWFALYLPCALCHFTLSLFIVYFSTMSSLYICIVCMYIWLNCIYLYLNVYCQCLMLTVCTKGLRVTQFQFSVCMYCTCGRIDNKYMFSNIIPKESTI